ncbi:MAG: hypothetical protein L6V35_04765 [Alistipes putredinis]|nr:MAG: hypothetical protein L6V35_04765 [Alistipes putredinis]
MIFALIILYVITLVYMSVTERFRTYARIIGLQGWILLAVALLRLHTVNIPEMLFIVTETLVFKAVIVPMLLYRIIRRNKIDRIAGAGASQFGSLLGSMLALAASVTVTYWVADNSTDMLFFGAALYALLSGLVLITRRKRIFAHMVGFLIIENGVFLFSMAIGVHMPILINIAILLDILISVLMLGMFITRLGERLHTDDTDALTRIKD